MRRQSDTPQLTRVLVNAAINSSKFGRKKINPDFLSMDKPTCAHFKSYPLYYLRCHKYWELLPILNHPRNTRHLPRPQRAKQQEMLKQQYDTYGNYN